MLFKHVTNAVVHITFKLLKHIFTLPKIKFTRIESKEFFYPLKVGVNGFSGA